MTHYANAKRSTDAELDPNQAPNFGKALWSQLLSRPFGSSNKRELEVMILQAAADAGLIDVTNPASTAALLSLSLSRAHGYLSDLAHRKPSLEDEAALILLGDQLSHVEVLPSDKHLSIPIQRADLRIWLERKLAADGLHPGESLRCDLVKLTPLSLLRLLDGTAKARKPEAMLKSLSQQLDQPEWVETARQQWTSSTSWVDTINTFRSIFSLGEAIAKLLPLACIA